MPFDKVIDGLVVGGNEKISSAVGCPKQQAFYTWPHHNTYPAGAERIRTVMGNIMCRAQRLISKHPGTDGEKGENRVLRAEERPAFRGIARIASVKTNAFCLFENG